MCSLKWWAKNVVVMYGGPVLGQPQEEEVGPTFHVWPVHRPAKRPIRWLNWKIRWGTNLPSHSRGIRSKSLHCMHSIRKKSPKHWPKQIGIKCTTWAANGQSKAANGGIKVASGWDDVGRESHVTRIRATYTYFTNFLGTKNVSFNLLKVACLLQCIVMCY